jgi:hypothetical protein
LIYAVPVAFDGLNVYVCSTITPFAGTAGVPTAPPAEVFAGSAKTFWLLEVVKRYVVLAVLFALVPLGFD